jgi:hypothetical protein
MLGRDLHSAVVEQVHDPAAHDLPIRQRDEDLLARTATTGCGALPGVWRAAVPTARRPPHRPRMKPDRE